MRKYSLKRQIWTISTYGIRLMRNLIVSDFQLRDGKQHNLAPLTGSPNDGVLLNALKTLFRLSSVLSNLLEMHSKRRYKSCICSVVLGQLKSFRNYLGPQYYFPENFRYNFRFYESENFSDSCLHRIFESENFRFPFSTKNRLTWGLKCEKLNFRKSQGIYQISDENCT